MSPIAGLRAGYLCTMVEVKVPEARIRRADSYSIFRALLDQSPEPADVTLFSFSVAEVWIRRFMDLKAAGRIRRLTVCANFEIMGRQTTPCMMLDGICDAFYLTNTHAKMLYMEDAGGGASQGGRHEREPHGELPRRGVLHHRRPGRMPETEGGHA